jgi:NTP pyrophosphatase (non-canonical NTP hydrolase)
MEYFDLIREWAKQRGIFDSGDVKTQTLKLYEEAGELAQATLKQDADGVKDAIGDIVVVLTNLAHLHNMTIEDCIESAYNEIKNRTGVMQNGTFKKD